MSSPTTKHISLPICQPDGSIKTLVLDEQQAKKVIALLLEWLNVTKH